MIRLVSARRWRELVDAASRLKGLAADAAGTQQALHQERAAHEATRAEYEQLRQHLAERAERARVEACAHASTVARLEAQLRDRERVVEAQRERLARRRQEVRDREAELAAVLRAIGQSGDQALTEVAARYGVPERPAGEAAR